LAELNNKTAEYVHKFEENLKREKPESAEDIDVQKSLLHALYQPSTFNFGKVCDVRPPTDSKNQSNGPQAGPESGGMYHGTDLPFGNVLLRKAILTE
jgi:hypothetical protein